MSLPTQYDVRLRKIEKSWRQSKDEFQTNGNLEELAVEVQDLANSCRLLLDRFMNEVWERYSAPNANRPNVYFPKRASEEGLSDHLKKLHLGDLKDKAPEIFAQILDAQPAENKSWLQNLFELSATKHQSDPELSKETRAFTAIGQGQNSLYIERLEVNEGKISHLSGHSTRADGTIEPIRISHGTEDIPSLTDSGEKAFQVCDEILLNTRRFLSVAFMKIKKR
ncbi:hypothetical protein [Thioclava sp. JM3]|uniref:hypothetical protein n=1 Tax=Thioclava sp. JM3 TaxID=1973004 RepID=UPI00117FA4BE|nr:hypothetical protein [Thioclava sp. JM3]